MKKVYLLGLLFFIVLVSNAQKITISGVILDLTTGEPVVGVTVYDTLSGEGSYTNAFGFFSIIVSNEKTYLRFSSVGYKTTYVKANAENGPMEIKLEANSNELTGVVIQADKVDVSQEVESTQMSMVKLNPDEVGKIPSLGGEVDILKVAQLMPGVAKAGEGQSGMLVRGGTADQNLVILDDATVYNLSHLFGFFSVFNNDAIRDVTIYTGGFPAQFGGRLSSVMDVRMAEGGAQKFSGKGGVGLLSSRLTLNVPIVKDKGAVMISGRRTYIDQVFKTVGVELPYYFYDLNLKANYKLSNKDHLYLSSYFGNDVLSFSEDTGNAEFEVEGGESQELGFGFQLGNFTSTLRWTHVYKEGKLFHNVTAFQTRFKYDIGGSFQNNNILIKSQIQDYGAKVDWDWNAFEGHRIKFGAALTNHGFRPNIVNTSGDITDFLKDRKGELVLSQEFGAYAVDDYKVNNRLSLNYGLRLSGSLTEGTPYGGVEPRASAKYTVVKNHSVKASYSRMKQYMHRVSSSSVVLPTDLWYPVTENVAPQSSHQVALGYFGGLEKLSVNYSVEGYYKYMQNLIEYREGAQLLLNDNFENELITGQGEAYGAEFMFRKKEGRLTGWVAYTLSWSKRHFDELNNGNTYFAKYDRRHYLSTVLMYDLNEFLTFSAIWEFTTGSRFTPQNGQYLMPNASFTGVETIPIYTDRNAVQMAPSHRLDLNLIIKGTKKRKFDGEWHVGVYNFYNRATPYRVNLELTELGYRYTQVGLFGLIPSIAYNFKF